MRATKQALATAFREDPALAELVPPGSIHAVERASIPTLPAVEIIAVSSEATEYLVRHEIALEVTVSHATEDAADEALNAIVAALRGRLLRAQSSLDPIADDTGSALTVDLGGTRWSVSAKGSGGVLRGASVAVTVVSSE